MNVPPGLRYTKEHEWVKIEGKTATVGITDYAQKELGDIVFVELPALGAAVAQMGKFGTIEAVKAVSDLYAPLSGKVVAINSDLDGDPMSINRDPYGAGWMIKLELTNTGEVEQLLDAGGYTKLLQSA